MEKKKDKNPILSQEPMLKVEKSKYVSNYSMLLYFNLDLT